jgi:hypothetical protein
MKWFGKVRTCLIRKLFEMDQFLTCSELKKQAFDSHYPCYVETRFCSLNTLDKFKIIALQKVEFKNPAIIKLGLK